jgi:hypothetical protein
MYGVQWQATIMHGESQELIRESLLSIYKNILLFALIKVKMKQRQQPKWWTECFQNASEMHYRPRIPACS